MPLVGIATKRSYPPDPDEKYKKKTITCWTSSKMNKEEIIELARKTAIQQNWTWLEPASAICRKKYLIAGRKIWNVRSNDIAIGCNVRIDIADDTGEILGKGFMPR